MTALQQKAIDIICSLPEENLVDIIRVLKSMTADKSRKAETDSIRMESFLKLEKMSSEIAMQLPSDFDAEKEIEQARLEKYDSFD